MDRLMMVLVLLALLALAVLVYQEATRPAQRPTPPATSTPVVAGSARRHGGSAL